MEHLLHIIKPYNLNVGVFDIVPEGSETILSSFNFFLLYSALQKLCPPFYLPAHWFVLLLQIFCYWFLLEYFFRVFLISVIVLFVSACLFFNSSRTLLIHSCIFSSLFSRFWSSLLSLFWIIFQVVCLVPLHLFGLLCF